MVAARATRQLGDTAIHVAASDMTEAHLLALAIRREHWAGVEEVVVGDRTVTVVADPLLAELDELAHRAARLATGPRSELSPKTVRLPVAFDGPDLERVAKHAGLTPPQVIEAIARSELVVAMVGFVPGFGYLVGLPDSLVSVPRLSTPRARLEAGSVAIAGGYAGVYPVATPGGWQVVGHTAAKLFDQETPPFAVLRPGDLVRFRPVDRIETRADPRREPLGVPAGTARVRVVSPGTLTTVQDGGRVGFAELGVPRAGAADPMSARLANRAVGNADSAALIEMTLIGARLHFGASRCVALVGDATISIDGTQAASGAVQLVTAGQVVSVGPIAPGARAFLAIAGGIESPLLLGSRSSDLLCGLGPGPLVQGDELALGEPAHARGRFEGAGRSTTLRVLRGPDPIADDDWARIESASYVVGARSDRTGVRLETELPLPAVEAVRGSVGMVTGAVQLPPDGQLIVLGVDHATVGGYPVVAAVVSADLPRLGQLRPGDSVGLERVDRTEAATLRRRGEASFGRRLRGWYPVQAG